MPEKIGDGDLADSNSSLAEYLQGSPLHFHVRVFEHGFNLGWE
jgi:hypothetical protein